METKKSHGEFVALVKALIQETAPDICAFADVPEFSREFGALCEKYRERAGFYEAPDGK